MVLHLIVTTLAGEETQLAIELQEYDRFHEFENAVLEQLPNISWTLSAVILIGN